jgi:type IV secretory pathway VirB6-like protein
MTYQEKFERLRKVITEKVLRIMQEYYESGYFNIEISDPHYLCEMYVDEFKKEFGSLVTPRVENTLFMAGKMLGFAVQSHQSTTSNFSVKKLIEYVHTFVDLQFDDFGNWCDDISMAMYET